MKSAWLTYAWDDNTDRDVDYIAQELSDVLNVKLDRWNLSAGKRLWEQIASFIQDPDESDAWLLYATQASLGSEACREEFAYALDRALHTRGGDFPVLGLFPSSVDQALIPAGIRTRLHVSSTDPDWKERIVAAVEGRSTEVARTPISPYVLKQHALDPPHPQRYAIEIRPRAGVWCPFAVGIPASEQQEVNPSLMRGPANRIPELGYFGVMGEGVGKNGEWWFNFANDEATPTQSYFLLCNQLPSTLIFGVLNGPPQYKVALSR